MVFRLWNTVGWQNRRNRIEQNEKNVINVTIDITTKMGIIIDVTVMFTIKLR